MDKYLGISYLKDGEQEWTKEELEVWKQANCPKGEHLWDEVLSTERHYLYCDACGKTREIKRIDNGKIKTWKI